MDRTYQVPRITLGEVHRAGMVTEEFAGKGVNVSHNLSLAGISSPAVVPLHESDRVLRLGDGEVISSPCESPLRVNITTIEHDGRTTKINQSANALSEAEWVALRETTVRVATEHRADWVLVAGRFPEDGPRDGFGPDALRSSLPSHTRIAVDTSAEGLSEWARSGVVDCVKPNVSELQEVLGVTLATLGEVALAARELVSWGVGVVAVSLGADGFLAVSDSDTVWAKAPKVTVVNTIGAGDASLAGFFASYLSKPDDLGLAARSAAQWGAHKVGFATSQLPHLEGLPDVQVTRDLDLGLEVIAD